MTNTQTETTPTSRTKRSRPFNFSRLAAATVAAVITNLVVYVVALSTGASLAVTQPETMEIPWFLVLIASTVPVALAGSVTWVIARRQPRFRAVAQWLGLGIALLSIASAVLSAADGGTAMALSLMHVVSGIAWFAGVGRPSIR